jgi:two-component sensor histidine kinase
MKILVVDDDFASLTLLSSLVAQTGNEIFSAKNGTDAWSVISTSAEPPSIVILDWLMPGLDGAALCRRIRAQPTHIPVYIIMLTIKGGKEDIVEGLDAGANDYLTKPFDPGELFSRIRVGVRTIELEKKLATRIVDLEIKERKVQTLLAEKELLLFEVHHRIKNNMSMIVNLLNLQAETINDETSRIILRNAVGRIKTMGILYDKLYRSEDVNEMSIKKYLPALIDEIAGIFPDRYKVDLDIEIEDFNLDVPRLSCLGIIINELVFNSMKYAFTDKDGGTISVIVTRHDGMATILFEDDGNGIQNNIDLDMPQTFGFKLVSGLSKQLGGTIRVNAEQGTRFTLEFPL